MTSSGSQTEEAANRGKVTLQLQLATASLHTPHAHGKTVIGCSTVIFFEHPHLIGCWRHHPPFCPASRTLAERPVTRGARVAWFRAWKPGPCVETGPRRLLLARARTGRSRTAWVNRRCPLTSSFTDHWTLATGKRQPLVVTNQHCTPSDAPCYGASPDPVRSAIPIVDKDRNGPART